MLKSHPPHQLLVVDDHDDTRDVTARILENHGYLVMTAANVATALVLARRFRFDLLIADVQLPDGSGLDLLARIREVRPIIGIVVSGLGRSSDVAGALAAGFAHHFLKPVNVGRVLQAIDQLLSQAPPPPEPAEVSTGERLDDQDFLQVLDTLPPWERRRLRNLLTSRTDEAAAAMLRMLDGGGPPPAITPPGS